MNLDLEAIKAREAAATKGPWAFQRRDWMGRPTLKAHITGDIHDDEHDSDDTPGVVGTAVAIVEGNNTSFEITEANARFITRARTDIPDLVNELESLRSQLAAANERSEVAIVAGAKLVGERAGAAGFVTTNGEDRAEFLALAGLEST